MVADLFVLTWLAAWWWAGRLTDAVVRAIAEPGRQAARLGADVETQLGAVATQAGGVPMVGDGLRQPFERLATTVDDLVASADAQVASIEQAATVAGWVVFLIPALLMVAVWWPRRLAFARRARETLRLAGSREGVQLLALRALVTQSLGDLTVVASDPVAGWRAGDAATVARLAELELAAAGVGRWPGRR